MDHTRCIHDPLYLLPSPLLVGVFAENTVETCCHHTYIVERRPHVTGYAQMINTRIAILAVAAGMMVGSAAPAAPGQVALVEDVTGNPAGVALMDYLETGKTIALGPRDSVVLSYMSSCVRETITGGTVTIGTD